MTPDQETGAQLADAIRMAARERGVPLTQFLMPLTAEPRKYMSQLTEAQSPRPLTRNRIRALLDETTMPRPRRIQTRDETPRLDVAKEPVEPPRQRVYREPCPNCAVRADVGCKHRPWTLNHNQDLGHPNGL